MTTATPPAKITKKSSGIVGVYDHFARFADKWRSPFLLLIRVYIGYQCVISGYAHITHFHTTVDAFKSWHIPMPEVNVAMSALTEIGAGALLIVGFVARLAGLLLTGNFLVAFLAVNLSDPKYHEMLRHFWDSQDVLLKDDAFPYLVTAIIILIFGPGFLSVDGIIKAMRGKK
jgi:putative oxidoreductase